MDLSENEDDGRTNKYSLHSKVMYPPPTDLLPVHPTIHGGAQVHHLQVRSLYLDAIF